MTASSAEQPLLLESRFEPIRTLRSGDGVRTMMARDLHAGTEVVLKTARAALVTVEERDRISAEVAFGSASCTPALVPLQHWGVDGETLFTSSPWVQGVPLDARLRQGLLSLRDTLALARGTLLALEVLHDHGRWHLQIRPSKLVLVDDGCDTALLPVGLSRTSRLQQLGHDEPHDQLRFSAPEQLGLIAREVTGRADLYSVGVLIHLCLTGCPPFDGDTVVDLLGRQAVTPPPPLRMSRRDIPAVVEEVVERLLRKDPEDRYQTAAAAIADIRTIETELAGGTVAPALVLGRHDRRHSLTEPSLVGRSAELGRLTGLLDQARRIGGGVVVEGESGTGKSRLLEEVREDARRQGFVIFDGSRLEPGQRRPLGAFAGIVEQVRERVAVAPEWGAGLRARLPDGGGALAAVLPRLADLLSHPVEEVAAANEFGRDRTVRTLATFLSALGSPEVPALIVIDDVHWADSLTIEALAEWQSSHATGSSALLVAASRSDEGRHVVSLLAPTALDHLVVPHLTEPQMQALVESSAGPVPVPAIDVIGDWAQGNPFMVIAALRGLVEAGALVPGADGWQLDEANLDAARVGSTAATILSGRLGRLSTGTQRLLSIGAVLGTRFEVVTAARLLEQPVTDTERSADEAARANIIFACGSGEFSFVHHRIQEEVLRHLDADALRDIHGRVAADLESHHPARAFELAHHYDAAGEHLRAVEFALPAARQARRQYAFDLAEDLYRIASHAGEHIPRAQQREVATELGEILKLRGRYEEALAYITTARSLSDTDEAIARAEAELGELALKRGRSDDARDHLETAIRRCGGRVPRSTTARALGLCWQLFLRGLSALRPRGHRPSRPELSTLAQLYHRLLYPSWFNQSALLSLWTDLRQLNLARRGGDQLALGRALAVHAALVSGILPGLSRRCLTSVDRAAVIQERLNDAWGQAQSLKYRGAVLYAAGRFAESESCMRETLRLLGRMGDLWEGNLAHWYQAMAQYRRGAVATSAQVAERTYHSALEIGDRQAAAISLSTWAKASGGRIPRDLLTPEIELTGDIDTRVSLLQARALLAMSERDLPTAEEALEQARRLVVRARLFNIFTAPTFTWLATARRLVADAVPTMAGRRRRARLRRAGRSAVLALCVATVYRHDMPHALREAGLIAALCGRERTARKLLRASITSAERRDAALEAELSRSALATLADPEGVEGLAGAGLFVGSSDGASMEFTSGASAPAAVSGVAQLQRHSALLHAGRVLTAAGSQKELGRSLCEAAVTLLRAERCTLLDVGAVASSDRTVANLELTEPSVADRVHIGRAVSLDDPVSVHNEDPGESPEVRSALYAPITVRGNVVACLRAVHGSVDGMFGEDERRLASFIAALGGTALERIALQDELLSSVIAAQEAERARVSRDLHDEIGQGLTSVLLGLSGVEAECSTDDDATARVVEVRTIINELIVQVRQLAFELRPTILDDLGLGAALRRLADDVSTRNGITVDLDAEPLALHQRLPSTLESTIYRVAQEALTNVVRHSGATECSVFVGREGPHLRLLVEDDGSGFEPLRVRHESLGLRGMRERASLVGGSLRVASLPGHGTSVVLEVPVD